MPISQPENQLDAFFAPRGIAIIGASRNPTKLGHSIVKHIIRFGYPGAIYPINPSADTVADQRAYASVLDAPDPLDLAVIAVPAALVPDELERCGQRGVPAVLIISAGFREVGPKGTALEAQCLAITRRYGMRMLGPNIVGAIDSHTPLNTSFVARMPQPGDIAFLTQSGALATMIIEWSGNAGIGFSRLVSLGNQADVNETDMIAALSRDGHTRAITAYLEGIADGQRFVTVTQDVARKIPVLALKAGRSDAAAHAVASHTGSLAGSDAAYDAAFRRAGVLRANTLEELFDWGRALAWQPLPKSNRAAVLTNAGGMGILAVDALHAAGMELATLTAETQAFMRQRVPAVASVGNPVDIIAGTGPATYALCLDALLNDPNVDSVVVITAPQDWFALVSLADVLGEFTAYRKPILATIVGVHEHPDAVAALNKARIPYFAFPERASSALGALWRRRQWLDTAARQEPGAPPAGCDTAASDRVLASFPGGGWLSADQAGNLLRAYSIPTPRTGFAPDRDAALALAEQIGYPVALKLAAADVVHKSEAGGVVLDIATPDALRTECDALLARAAAQLPANAIEGVTVQQMIPTGVELVAGVVRDPQFGPLVMAGIGGVQVELLRAVDFELAPLTTEQASDLLDRTPAGTLLDGFRGAPPTDRAAVVEAIVRLAQLATDHPQIAEIEINPLIVLPEEQGAWAVDARVRIAATG